MSTFVIPMAGLSSRFFKAGYKLPKYQLPINDISMFSWSVSSFKEYFYTDYFVFIVRDEFNSREYVDIECNKLGIKNYYICVLNENTIGQAETVFLGLSQIPHYFDNDIFIFNIDSRIDSYEKPRWIFEVDGYLELFNASGNHWSFARVDSENNVIQTTEKVRISDYASNGLYFFKSRELFNIAYTDAVSNKKLSCGEMYIAPLYNYLIQEKYIVKGRIIDYTAVKIAGTPEEYTQLLEGGQVDPY